MRLPLAPQVDVIEQKVNVEIIPADIDVILISEKRKAGAKFQ